MAGHRHIRRVERIPRRRDAVEIHRAHARGRKRNYRNVTAQENTMPRRPDPQQMNNRQRIARAEFLDSRMAGDKEEKRVLKELIIADLNNPQA